MLTVSVLFQARMERRRCHIKTASHHHWTLGKTDSCRTTNKCPVLPPCCSQDKHLRHCRGLPYMMAACEWQDVASRGRQCRWSHISCSSSSNRVRYLCFRQRGRTRPQNWCNKDSTTVSSSSILTSQGRNVSSR